MIVIFLGFMTLLGFITSTLRSKVSLYAYYFASHSMNIFYFYHIFVKGCINSLLLHNKQPHIWWLKTIVIYLAYGSVGWKIGLGSARQLISSSWLGQLLCLKPAATSVGASRSDMKSSWVTHSHSFLFLFSSLLAWTCSYGSGRVLRTNSNVQAFFKSLHFSCLPFVSMAKTSHMI